jgi:hypothetical protein
VKEEIWRDSIFNRRFRNIRAEMNVGRIVGGKNKKQRQTTGIYTFIYEYI